MRYFLIVFIVLAAAAAAWFWNHQRLTALERLRTAGATVETARGDEWYGRWVWKVTKFDPGEARPDDRFLVDMGRIGAQAETLNLSGTQVTDSGVSGMGSCATLKRLNLSGSKVTDAVGSILGKCQALLHLDLSDTAFGDKGMSQLAGLTNLDELSIARTQVSDAGLQAAGIWQQLEYLNVARSGVGGEFLDAAAQGCELRSLVLDGMELQPEIFGQLSACKQLRTLSLAGTDLDDGDAAKVLALSGLQELNVSVTGMTGQSIRQFLKMPLLRTLRASDIDAGKGLGTEPLKSMRVARLTLMRAGLGDSHIPLFTGLDSLRYFDLAGNELSMAAVPSLELMKNLEEIHINDTGLPVNAAHRLYASLPRVIVYYGWGGAENWLGADRRSK